MIGTRNLMVATTSILQLCPRLLLGEGGKLFSGNAKRLLCKREEEHNPNIQVWLGLRTVIWIVNTTWIYNLLATTMSTFNLCWRHSWYENSPVNWKYVILVPMSDLLFVGPVIEKSLCFSKIFQMPFKPGYSRRCGQFMKCQTLWAHLDMEES